VDFDGPEQSSWYDNDQSKTEKSRQSALKSCPGPGPPKSWTLTSKDVVHETARAWRAKALSLIFSHIHPSLPIASHHAVPPLTQLCLQRILSLSSGIQFIEDVIPFLPSHLRRDLIHYTAIHSPLSGNILFALYEPEGHADGEVVVVGPDATLRDDYFLRVAPSTVLKRDVDEVWDWDSEKSVPEPLCRFILINSRLAVSTLLTLPPTITHLALIDLPTVIPLHRLPGTCPMLVFLDLSYNAWLNDKFKDAFERVEWNRWNCLRVLGLRECHISNEMRVKVNKGRWDDVEIVQ
jgi:hypothetical protein